MRNKLPNFLIVGAAKSGTSSLHNYLNQHKEVFMPSFNDKGMKVKEPRFLIKELVENRLHNGIWNWQEYQSLFDSVNNEKAIGESTVLYLYYFEHAIANIKKYLGSDVKIIIMLRNPLDRAYSAFQHVSRGFKETESFEEALKIEDDRLKRNLTLTPMVMYKSMGLYYNMVKAYLEAFKNVHIIFYEDFKDNTEKELIKVFKFLNLSQEWDIDFLTRHNVGGRRWKNNIIKHFFMKDNLIKYISKLIIPKNIRKKVRFKLFNLATNNVSPMNNKTRIMLNNYFKDDINKLSKLLKKDLQHWIE